jgi:hypothetical protein
VRVVGHVEPIRERVALVDTEADPHGDPRTVGRWRAVVDDPYRSAGEVDTVERAVEAERLTEAPGTAREVTLTTRFGAPLAHHIDACDRRGSS